MQLCICCGLYSFEVDITCSCRYCGCPVVHLQLHKHYTREWLFGMLSPNAVSTIGLLCKRAFVGHWTVCTFAMGWDRLCVLYVPLFNCTRVGVVHSESHSRQSLFFQIWSKEAKIYILLVTRIISYQYHAWATKQCFENTCKPILKHHLKRVRAAGWKNALTTGWRPHQMHFSGEMPKHIWPAFKVSDPNCQAT